MTMCKRNSEVKDLTKAVRGGQLSAGHDMAEMFSERMAYCIL
ncbi:hypothetical protein SNOG_06891 [Parastagonospora nodorum SN15]|uniref:Uncharacterized protein n=1 Tax=Phaeosphaeria nodorum (strain SN15 / ATCC MYA-4574 / FGSC 10173) TaxID=321614 RepID=Q0UMX3_PHANO|nr:hypothetical protein SNOG_06891 [Parastagonospora nodorum SN15]EAT85542.1 hypothetical protein SNOG_06891 [Parastagonospora nodorum SN15]